MMPSRSKIASLFLLHIVALPMIVTPTMAATHGEFEVSFPSHSDSVVFDITVGAFPHNLTLDIVQPMTVGEGNVKFVYIGLQSSEEGSLSITTGCDGVEFGSLSFNDTVIVHSRVSLTILRYNALHPTVRVCFNDETIVEWSVRTSFILVNRDPPENVSAVTFANALYGILLQKAECRYVAQENLSLELKFPNGYVRLSPITRQWSNCIPFVVSVRPEDTKAIRIQKFSVYMQEIYAHQRYLL